MTTSKTHDIHYPEPRVTQFLFASKAMAPLWTIVRIYLGWQWLTSGWGKVTGGGWVGAEAGGAVRGFLGRALTLAQGERPSVSAWYAWLIEHVFLPNAVVMSHFVAIGEVLVGLALIAGFLTGASAFFGGLMKTSMLLSCH